ncbi:MAG: RNA methyltransferase [Eubacteriales bacterium]|nr:RNA methyltransferase [Eubacteriales bacterium]
MKRITSQDNPVWKQIKKLQRKKGRDAEASYLIEGFHLLEEALNTETRLTMTLIRESLLEDEPEEMALLIERLESQGTKIFAAPNDGFDSVSDTETPQGILSVVKKRELSPDDFFLNQSHKGTGNVIVLDRLQDPGNVGTILRTADAAGFLGALIVKGSADVYGAKVVRAASGSLFRLPLLFVDSPEDALSLLARFGKQTAATTPYGSQDYYECQIAENTAIVIGNEGAGVSESFLDKAKYRMKIPMESNVESLNAAVAAGILIFESTRQKKYPIDGGK